MLGDVKEGRPNLGFTVDVTVYRLMQLTLRKELNERLGGEVAVDLKNKMQGNIRTNVVSRNAIMDCGPQK